MEIRNRAAYMVTPGKMEIRELPMPQAQPGEVVLKIEYVGVCGSDAHFFESGMRKGKAFDLPFILGHECAGTVTQVGAFKMSPLETGSALSPRLLAGFARSAGPDAIISAKMSASPQFRPMMECCGTTLPYRRIWPSNCRIMSPPWRGP
mgnify:CR=1 FL=1